MQINIGNKIRELRHKNNKTQEALADALGVTCQAVSRWESNKSYPDMEMIPSIANYFKITIDELFGYEHEREQKIQEIIHQIDSYHIKARSDTDWIEECISILREGLAEFPQNEKLLIMLADVLSEAGCVNIMNGFIMTKKDLFNMIMKNIKKMNIGMNPLKYVNISSIMQQIILSLQKPFKF